MVLVPLCLAVNPAREITVSGPLVPALAGVGVHTAAMLVTIGGSATGVRGRVALRPRLPSGTAPCHVWPGPSPVLRRSRVASSHDPAEAG